MSPNKEEKEKEKASKYISHALFNVKA